MSQVFQREATRVQTRNATANESHPTDILNETGIGCGRGEVPVSTRDDSKRAASSLASALAHSLESPHGRL